MAEQNVETYAALCRKELDKLINGSFLNTNPFELDDATIILDAMERSKSWPHSGISFCSDVGKFCSLMKVDGERTIIYHLDRYVDCLEVHPLNYTGKERLDIPFNHFLYPMMLDRGDGGTFEEKKATLASSLDGRHDKEYILTSNNGIVLYSHCLGGITKFGQKRFIYRFVTFTIEKLPKVLRNEIAKSQHEVLEHILLYPEYFRPNKPSLLLTEEIERKVFISIFEEYRDELEQKRILVKSYNNS